MKCLVNFITRRKNGNISTKPKIVEASSIGIGRATDQEIFLSDLRIAYHHAEIVTLDQGFFIQANALSGIRVNKSITQSVQLIPGVKVEIGNYQLTVIESGDYDLAIEIEQIFTSDTQDEELKQESKLDLNKTGMNKRLLSWIAFATIFLLFFILPLSSSLFQPVKNMTDAVPLIPSDTVWKSGPIASVHHFFKKDCTICHQSAFRQVKDEACTDCHSNTHKHAADELMVDQNINLIACQDCHKEHNGPDGIIKAGSEDFCSDCHSELKATLGNKTKLLDASDFGTDHPEFQPSIPYEKNGETGIYRVSMDDAKNLKELNALIFSHKAHLHPDKPEKFVDLTKNKTDKMVCSDCHVPDSGGKQILPVNFEQHCESCHELKAGNKQNPIQLPHEATTEVYYYIEQHYKALALEGGVPDTTAPESVRRRRRPGQTVTQAERLEALAWANKKAKQIALDVFKFTLCKTCHQVTYSNNDTPPWNIVNTKIPELWLPLAKFNHAKHGTMECNECHDVEKSENGSDVLLPKIADCRDCHGGSHDSEILASTCTDCHSFHVGEELLKSSVFPLKDGGT